MSAVEVKLIMVGNSSVGKTSLLRRLVSAHFDEGTEATIGIDFAYKKMLMPGGPVNLSIWDTCGAERFRSLAISYFRNAAVIVLVADLTARTPETDLEEWLRDVRLVNDHAPCIIALNKFDCIDQSKAADRVASMRAWGERHGIAHKHVILTSARSGVGVDSVFRTAAALGIPALLPIVGTPPLRFTAAPDSAAPCCIIL